MDLNQSQSISETDRTKIDNFRAIMEHEYNFYMTEDNETELELPFDSVFDNLAKHTIDIEDILFCLQFCFGKAIENIVETYTLAVFGLEVDLKRGREIITDPSVIWANGEYCIEAESSGYYCSANMLPVWLTSENCFINKKTFECDECLLNLIKKIEAKIHDDALQQRVEMIK